MPNRSIRMNVPDLDVCDNRIKTSKYTLYNFLPLNLLVQFSKVANVYFLIIGIMQMIKSISVSGGFPVIFIPLSIVVGVSAFKDFYEDLKRKSSDAEINNKQTQKLTEEGFKPQTWSEIRIGDVLKVQKN
jgi:phospholipid-transporting ATPase